MPAERGTRAPPVYEGRRARPLRSGCSVFVMSGFLVFHFSTGFHMPPKGMREKFVGDSNLKFAISLMFEAEAALYCITINSITLQFFVTEASDLVL